MDQKRISPYAIPGNPLLRSSRWAIDQFAAIAESLNDAELINRVFASFAISKIVGLTTDTDFGVDIMKAPETRQLQIDTLVETVELRMKK